MNEQERQKELAAASADLDQAARQLEELARALRDAQSRLAHAPVHTSGIARRIEDAAARFEGADMTPANLAGCAARRLREVSASRFDAVMNARRFYAVSWTYGRSSPSKGASWPTVRVVYCFDSKAERAAWIAKGRSEHTTAAGYREEIARSELCADEIREAHRLDKMAEEALEAMTYCG